MNLLAAVVWFGGLDDGARGMSRRLLFAVEDALASSISDSSAHISKVYRASGGLIRLV